MKDFLDIKTITVILSVLGAAAKAFHFIWTLKSKNKSLRTQNVELKEEVEKSNAEQNKKLDSILCLLRESAFRDEIRSIISSSFVVIIKSSRLDKSKNGKDIKPFISRYGFYFCRFFESVYYENLFKTMCNDYNNDIKNELRKRLNTDYLACITLLKDEKIKQLLFEKVFVLVFEHIISGIESICSDIKISTDTSQINDEVIKTKIIRFIENICQNITDKIEEII